MAEETLKYASLLPEKKRNKVSRSTELAELPSGDAGRKLKMRLGRGKGTGKGKTSGRGQKGQKSRAGYSMTPGFEGGQMPLHRRLPKRGFSSPDPKSYQTINLWVLEKSGLSGELGGAELQKKGLVADGSQLIKILGTGDIKSKVSLKVDAVSASAKQKIEAAGGSVEIRTAADRRELKKKKAGA
ncbi:MAG TPA: 50S ribosomal protein L15 [Leptospiraceae bacterium]|nr:50S ribosomal protein L15 [Spirochaetaceae bacterium]HBS05621.1 50S ribosomal protein L15 [Leptospiraceae bacterium]|tara:strand:- start:29927 stop:30481 length:555 start_codon:yes stop_codon:yes gene_type:complete